VVARLSLLVMAGFLVAGCLTWPVTLQHPVTKETARCGPYCCIYGARHTDAISRENRCLDDYQRQGYQRAP
jgi:hypothetical protein